MSNYRACHCKASALKDSPILPTVAKLATLSLMLRIILGFHSYPKLIILQNSPLILISHVLK